jgi:hypothetical protein
MALPKGSEKKLKRGLEDLSPLFRSQSPPATAAVPAAPTAIEVPFEVEFLAVCTPDQEGDAFLANAYVASQVVRQTPLRASLVSIVPGFNALPARSPDPFPSFELLSLNLSRITVSHQELWSFMSHPCSPSSVGFPTTLVFLEFEPAQFHSLARIALLLDRIIFFVQPQAESLREAYRLMKVFWHLNREIEFSLLFRAPGSSGREEEFLFERFSLIASRFLGISTEWLGNLAFPENKNLASQGEEKSSGFNPESFLASEGLRRPLSPEKSRFWHVLRKILERRISHESPR